MSEKTYLTADADYERSEKGGNIFSERFFRCSGHTYLVLLHIASEGSGIGMYISSLQEPVN